MTDTNIRAFPALQLAGRRIGVRALAATTLFAALTALGARVAIPLPFTPVPITLQVFFVLLAGITLGRRLGALSIAQYLAFGAMGLPVFSNGGHGLGAFGGPTAGYLPGFVLAAWLVGLLSERMQRPSPWKVSAACLAGIAAIYVPGVIWLTVWLRMLQPLTPSMAIFQGVLAGAVPFLAVDLLKAAAASFVGVRLRK